MTNAGILIPSPGFSLAPSGLRQSSESKLIQMEAERDRKMGLFREIEAFTTPYSTNIDQQTRRYNGVSPDILDETIFFARTTLASGLYWGMTNPSRRWREWAVGDPDLAEHATVKDWLHTVNERAMVLLANSNFYETMSWVYDEWPAFGTAVVLIEEDERDVFRYVPFGIGSYALADDANGDACALSRRFLMTVRQVVQRFATKPDGSVDLGKLSLGTASKARNGQLEQQVEVCHLICPNESYDGSKGLPEHWAYGSYYWESGSGGHPTGDGMLAKEGYREWPAMVFRWKRVPGDAWGTDSPGIMTLAGNKALQAMQGDLLTAIEKQVHPPLMVPPELQVPNLLPGARNAVRPTQHMQIGPLHETHPTAIQQTRETLAEAREMVMALWYTRLMLAFTGGFTDDRDKTATEVQEISNEKYLVLARVIESAGRTFDRASDREFAIMQRRGFLPPVPPELDGRPLKVEYQSVFTQAQRSVGLGNLERFGMGMAEMGKVITDSGFQAKVDWAQYVDEIAQRSGIPPRVVRSDEDVAKIQAAQAAAVAAQQKAEQVALEARAAKDASQASMEGDTALTRVVNSGLRPDQVGV